MKVSELITRLRTMPQDADVVVYESSSNYPGYNIAVLDVVQDLAPDDTAEETQNKPVEIWF